MPTKSEAEHWIIGSSSSLHFKVPNTQKNQQDPNAIISPNMKAKTGISWRFWSPLVATSLGHCSIRLGPCHAHTNVAHFGAFFALPCFASWAPPRLFLRWSLATLQQWHWQWGSIESPTSIAVTALWRFLRTHMSRQFHIYTSHSIQDIKCMISTTQIPNGSQLELKWNTDE